MQDYTVHLDTYTGTYFIKSAGKVIAANFLTRREADCYMKQQAKEVIL